MSNWLSTVDVLVTWRCECGEHLEGPCDELPCLKCGRVWHARTSLTIRYDDPPKPKELEQSGPSLWEASA